MTRISIQVGCGCQMDPENETGRPVGMNPVITWDGDTPNVDPDSGFVRGRRYMWDCPVCGNPICINLTLLDEEE